MSSSTNTAVDELAAYVDGALVEATGRTRTVLEDISHMVEALQESAGPYSPAVPTPDQMRREQDAAIAGYELGVDAALRCYSPDDTATDWADKISALKNAAPRGAEAARPASPSLGSCPAGVAPHEGYDQSALDAASREVHMMLLREGSSWGTKACEEMGRVFMTAYRKARASSAELKEGFVTRGGGLPSSAATADGGK